MTNIPDSELIGSSIEQAAEFARGTVAEHPYGVLYQGEWETLWDGTCSAVRRHARALADTGLPVLLTSFSHVVIGTHGIPEPVHTVGVSAEVDREVAGLRMTSIATVVPRIQHLVVRSAEHLGRVLIPHGVVDANLDRMIAMRQAILRATIVYSVWERDRIDAGIVRQLARAAECWVPCRQNQELLVRAGVPAEQIRVMPHPYAPDDPLLRLVEREPVTDWKLFYSIGGWQPRKGYDKLIGAFLLAFKPQDRAVLTIKYTGGQWKDYPTPEACVSEWLRDPRVQANGWDRAALGQRLSLVGERMPASEIVRLHFMHNLYVSSGYGEAWCLPAFDAKLAGNRVVHVPYGGTADFCDQDDVEVPWQLGPAHASYGWEPDACWANYSVTDLAHALARAEPPARHGRKASFEQAFSRSAVGALMAERAVDVAERVDAKAARYLQSKRREA